MGSKCFPHAPLPLPNYPRTNCINVPRTHQLLHLHVHSTQHVEAQVGVIDEVSVVDGAILVIHHRHVVVQHALEPEVEHALACLTLSQWDRELITHSLTIHAIDVTAHEDHARLIALERKVHHDVIEHFFYVRAIKTTSKHVSRSAPLRLSSAIDATQSSGEWVRWNKTSKAQRVSATANSV